MAGKKHNQSDGPLDADNGGLDEEGDALWSRLTDTVTPNKARANTPPFAAPSGTARETATRASPPPKATPHSSAKPGPTSVPGPRAPVPLRHGAAPGVDRRTATKLQRGQLPIEGTLDLHGETRDGAETALGDFIERHVARGSRCVLVVTGRGQNHGGEGSWSEGVLRAALPDWLNRAPMREHVLSFSYAQPQHGGTGAVYILLKRAR